MIYKVRNFIGNLIYWWRFLWNDRQFDYGYLYSMMAHKLQRMYEHHSDKLNDKDLRKLHTAMLLCHRIVQEDYAPFVDGDFIVPKRWDNLVPYEYYMTKQDMDSLSKILKTQSLKWWD